MKGARNNIFLLTPSYEDRFGPIEISDIFYYRGAGSRVKAEGGDELVQILFSCVSTFI